MSVSKRYHAIPNHTIKTTRVYGENRLGCTMPVSVPNNKKKIGA